MNLENQISRLTEKIDSVVNIRDMELPDYDKRIRYTQVRMNKLSAFLVRFKE